MTNYAKSHAIGGGIIGGLFGAASSRNPYKVDGTKRNPKNQKLRMLGSTLLGAGIGALGGGAIGELKNSRKFHMGEADRYSKKYYKASDDLFRAERDASWAKQDASRAKRETDWAKQRADWAKRDADWAKDDAKFWRDRYDNNENFRSSYKKDWDHQQSSSQGQRSGEKHKPGFPSGFGEEKPDWLRNAKTKAEAAAAYKAQARKHHPDMGGSHKDMTNLNTEWSKWKTKFGSALYRGFFDELENIKAYQRNR